MTTPAQTPDTLLIEEILSGLKKEILLPEKQLETLRAKLAAGTMSSEDWRVMIELVVDAEAKNV